jgi:hypothetical protein
MRATLRGRRQTPRGGRRRRAELAGYVAEVARKDEEISLLGDEVSRLECGLWSARSQVSQFSSNLSGARRALSVYEGISHVPRQAFRAA